MRGAHAQTVIEIGLGAAVAIFGGVRVLTVGSDAPRAALAISLAMGLAMALYRRAPLVALALVWISGVIQVTEGLDVAFVQLVVVVVAYGSSRYGRRVTVVASLVSIPLGSVAAILYAVGSGEAARSEAYIRQLLDVVLSATDVGFSGTASSYVIGFVTVVALLAVPWSLGLVVRLREQSRRSDADRARAEADTLQAQQLAELRARQSRLARDVHDVVGHSLAVIVSQADSTQAMTDGEVERMRAAIANIGATARRSLGDVRAVLSDGPEPSHAGHDTSDLESLVESVRAGGSDLELAVRGVERPLPPELEVVAYRTLQELLTNALKHGRPGGLIEVDLGWGGDELTMTVRNECAEVPGPGGRSGLAGIRDRIASVGGRVEAERAGSEWTSSARIPFVGRVA